MPDKRWNIVNGPAHGDASEGIETLPAKLRSQELCDEAFEANLPDDYQILAAQLTSDADYLACKYPSPTHEPLKTVAIDTPKPRWRPHVAAAIWLIAGAGLGVLAAKQYVPSHPVTADQAPIAPELNHTASISQPRGNAPYQAANPAGIQEVAHGATPTVRPALDEVKLLQIQIDAFEQVIRKLQDELARKEQAEAHTAQTIESLREEIAALRKTLDERSRADK